jgi:hypothetical protein
MHVANSGVDFSGSLEGVAKYLDGEASVKYYISSTTQKEVNCLAKLMVGLLQTEGIDHALNILINITFHSCNTSIYLMNVMEIVPNLLAVMNLRPRETAWLITHLLSDCYASDVN